MQRPPDVPDNVPVFLDWRHHDVFLSRVRKQRKNSGHCWAYATSSCLEAVYNATQRDRSRRVQLSSQELLNCVPTDKDRRVSNLKGVYNYIAEMEGLSLEEDCPYLSDKKYRCQPKKSVRRAIQCQGGFEEKNVDERVLLGLLARHPVSATIAGVLVPEDGDARNRIYIVKPMDPRDNKTAYHAVVIAGYGTQQDGRNYFLIRNSDGEEWGEGGYGKVIRRSSSNRRTVFSSYSYPVL